MPYRIIIAEATGTIPDTGQADSCLYIGIQSGRGLTGEIPAETLPRWMQASDPLARFDLMPPTILHTRKSTKKKRRQTLKKLTRMGYIVYGQEYGQRTEYSLYVIELKPAPGHPEGSPVPLYVGQTSKPIEERFQEHVEGGRTASRKATGRIERFRTDLILDKNRYYLREDAEKAETQLGIRLQNGGHQVYGPQNMPDNS